MAIRKGKYEKFTHKDEKGMEENFFSWEENKNFLSFSYWGQNKEEEKFLLRAEGTETTIKVFDSYSAHIWTIFEVKSNFLLPYSLKIYVNLFMFLAQTTSEANFSHDCFLLQN